MIQELDDVILACDDIGTVVLVHRNTAGCEVESTALDGDTIAVVTLMANQVRPVLAIRIKTNRDARPPVRPKRIFRHAPAFGASRARPWPQAQD